MNDRQARFIVIGVATTLGLSVAAHGALKVTNPREIPVPGPTVTSTWYKQLEVPVPGPTVTKKVPGPTKTVRVTPPASRSTARRPARKTQPPVSIPQGSAKAAAKAIFGSGYACADALITKESGWRVNATNPSSGAYGLPQALPGSKMASMGADWRTNPVTQLRWMKSYVDSRYGGVCAAWNHWQSNHWY